METARDLGSSDFDFSDTCFNTSRHFSLVRARVKAMVRVVPVARQAHLGRTEGRLTVVQCPLQGSRRPSLRAGGSSTRCRTVCRRTDISHYDVLLSCRVLVVLQRRSMCHGVCVPHCMGHNVCLAREYGSHCVKCPSMLRRSIRHCVRPSVSQSTFTHYSHRHGWHCIEFRSTLVRIECFTETVHVGVPVELTTPHECALGEVGSKPRHDL